MRIISCTISASFSAFSLLSLMALKRRERCWFIFARGATPSLLTRHHHHNNKDALIRELSHFPELLAVGA